jgi:DNA-directed RNA polymerase subunit RPC12/RpoP
MFSYTCLTCGASAYSSVNPSAVGACPRCSRALTIKDEAHAVAPPGAPAERGRPTSR